MDNFTGVKLFFLGLTFFLHGCSEQKSSEKISPASTKPAEKVKLPPAPHFNADSAYSFIKEQVMFGPRVPDTEAHGKCAGWLESKLNVYGMHVIVQNAEVTAYNGKPLKIKNIMGQFNKENGRRVVLFSHWDSRPYADRDKERRTQPIDAANDGASGVGVLLEIARLLQSDVNKPLIGIDIVLFDAEDYGQPRETMIADKSNTWCLGSQYWSKNIPVNSYSPRYGILLDMVGAKDAIFPHEGHSLYYAQNIVFKVWKAASDLGFGNYFINVREYRGITDDHYYVNTLAKIPTIDIIHYDPRRNDFGSFHHTHSDNMSIIDIHTLKAVGQTLMEVIYKEY